MIRDSCAEIVDVFRLNIFEYLNNYSHILVLLKLFVKSATLCTYVFPIQYVI